MRYVSLALLSLCCFSFTGCGGGSSGTAGNSIIPASLRTLHDASRRTIASTDTSTSYTALVAADAPIAYYRLNDSSATLQDSSAHALNGTYGANVRHDGGALTSAPGAQSAIFTGSAAGADIPSNTATVAANARYAAATTHLTVETWIKPAANNTTDHYVPLVSYGREVQGQAWVVQISPQSTIDFWIKTTGGAARFYSVKGSTVLTPGRIFHVVCTYDGAHAQLFVDGKLETSIAANGALDYSAIVANMGLAVGGALGSQEPIFNGTMSDVAIYPSALSAADVANHYAVGTISAATPTPAPTTPAYTSLILASNPLAYYKLDDGNATLTDSGPQRITGAYGAGVARKTTALTSANDPSATFPGSPAGTDVAANSATVAASNVFTQPTTGLSVEAWVKPADYNRTGDYVPVVSYGRQVIGSAWAIQLTPQSTLTFYLKVAGGSYLLTPSATLLPGQTYHVVATYDGSNVSLYLNGGLATSSAGHGAINYAGIAPQYGLSIGGALGGALPIFKGTINDVAIYASPLSPAAIEKHYTTGEIAVPVEEMPLASNAFVDTIGVVTHLRASNTPYTNSWPTFQTLIRASGIRHIGDTLISTPVGYAQHVLALAAAGIHASLITDLNQTASQIRSEIATFSPAIEAVEGPNEPDIIGDPNWVADTRAFASMLWSTVKSDGATSTLTVVGPSMVTLGDDMALGNLAGAMDDGSIHDYFDGYNPGTSGWGSLGSYGIYGSIAYNIAISAPVSGNHPVLSTETGYSSSPNDIEGVDSRTLARYIPRIFLEHYLHGIARTTLYEFYDEPGTGAFANFGLVTASNAPKSSYYALTSLIAALNDQGSSFTPTPLRYVLTGNMNNVHHLLLQRRDGTYQLVMWVEVAGYDPATKADVTVPPQAVTLAPANGATTGSIATIGDDGKLTTSAITFTNGVASFSVDDRVAIVSFK